MELRVDNPSVAKSAGLTVTGASPGFATANVRLGKLQAAAKLTVEGVCGPSRQRHPLPPGLRFIPDLLIANWHAGASAAGKPFDASARTRLIIARKDLWMVKAMWPDDLNASGVSPSLKAKIRAHTYEAGRRSPPMIEVVRDEEQRETELFIRFTEVGQTQDFRRVRVLGRTRSRANRCEVQAGIVRPQNRCRRIRPYLARRKRSAMPP